MPVINNTHTRKHTHIDGGVWYHTLHHTGTAPFLYQAPDFSCYRKTTKLILVIEMALKTAQCQVQTKDFRQFGSSCADMCLKENHL